MYICIYTYKYMPVAAPVAAPFITRNGVEASPVWRRIHACHMRRIIHACHMRRRIHACACGAEERLTSMLLMCC